MRTRQTRMGPDVLSCSHTKSRWHPGCAGAGRAELSPGRGQQTTAGGGNASLLAWPAVRSLHQQPLKSSSQGQSLPHTWPESSPGASRVKAAPTGQSQKRRGVLPGTGVCPDVPMATQPDAGHRARVSCSGTVPSTQGLSQALSVAEHWHVSELTQARLSLCVQSLGQSEHTSYGKYTFPDTKWKNR